jgi:hypothetical protein
MSYMRACMPSKNMDIDYGKSSLQKKPKNNRGKGGGHPNMPSSEIKFDNDDDERNSDDSDGIDRGFSLVDLPSDMIKVPEEKLKKSKTSKSLGNSLGNSQNKTEFDSSNKADSAE